MAFVYNMTIYKGTSFTQTFTWVENDVPVDLTNWDVKMQVKSDTYTYTLDENQILLSSTGDVTINLDYAYTLDMVAGSYDYDLLLRDPDGIIYPPIVSGVVTVKQGVTQW